MASSSSNPNPNPLFTPQFHMNFDPNINSSTPNTTFVQADPSNFRAVVQRLTGSTTQDPLTNNLPVTGIPNSGEMGTQRPAFKLHERRQTARKLEIQLNNNNNSYMHNAVGQIIPSFVVSPSCVSRQMMVSPVSTLDFFLGRGSPRTPMSPQEEEERAIAEKGFYLHPSPRGTPRGGGGGGVDPPQLLPLFPLQSPRSDTNNCPPS
ncbi:hypothetical protein Leryth_024008 [Lithospermum erythrorhizon]|uniref:VQ domain-containing protein n=1 Tax=Lithospermum erythrorhizon TaxID=34254 RepID=A0AAV3Q227_LITER|nr:hypothetical protein Leryth_024008 [Lithospermum erythrorhizon]